MADAGGRGKPFDGPPHCLNSAQGEMGRETTVGSAFSGAESTQSQNTASGLTMKQSLSGIGNDHVTRVVSLVAQQVAFQAALAATARAMTPSLTDFLR
jgi:flagellar hook-associated protein 3 FlgL